MAAKEEKKLTEMHPLPRRVAELKENGEGKGIFYFHVPGDYLYGILLSKQTVQTLHYPFSSFLIKAFEGRQDGVDLLIPEKGQVFEIPANWLPRRIIDDNELIGSLVKISYKGKKGQKKDYSIWKDTGTFYESEEKKHARSRKPKAGRKAGTKAGAGKKQLDKAARDDRSSRGPGGGQA